MAESQGNSVPNFSSHDNMERRSGTHDRRNKLKLFPTLPIANHALTNNTSSGHSDLMNLSALSRHSHSPHHHQHNHSQHHHHSGSNHHHHHHTNHHSHHHHQSQPQPPQQAASRVDGGGGGGGGLDGASWSRRSLPRVKPFSQQDIVWEKSREKFKFCQSIQSTGTLQVSPNDVAQDFTSGDLQDLGEIGRGAFGTVNKMVHRKSSTVMAVKRIRSTVDEKEQKQLLMDLEVVMKSNECPCIVQFYGALFKEGDCWICMELMDTSLDKFYKFIYETLNQRIPETTLGKITVATVRALNYLKEKLKIIHRDVKPSNILLDRRGNIKLCDFGISGQLVDSIARTRDAGCRPYMAPERIDPHRARGYDVRSDVWSLGITLMEVATGRFPYPKWNSVFEQLYQVVQGEPPRLTTNSDPSGLSFSVDFVEFVNTCLIKDELQRPKYNKLLEHAFIRRSEAAQVDVAGYVTLTLDNMANKGQTMFTMNMP